MPGERRRDRFEYATEEPLVLSPLPCWKHLSTEEYRERVRSLVEDIKREAALARESTGTPALGLQAILSQDPHHRPERIAKPPTPFVHAVSKAARLALYQSCAWFVAAFRRPPKSSDEGTPRPASRPAASHRPFLS